MWFEVAVRARRVAGGTRSPLNERRCIEDEDDEEDEEDDEHDEADGEGWLCTAS
jgi:hypothetical protein